MVKLSFVMALFAILEACRENTMEQTVIFTPVFVMLGLTMVVWVYMYVRRISFIRSNDFSQAEFSATEFARLSPPEVANPSDNLKNLFEIPILFYVMAGYLFVVLQVDMVNLIAAWIFVAFRILHSAIHCTVNIIMVRFYLYLIATLALWFIVVRAAVTHFAG